MSKQFWEEAISNLGNEVLEPHMEKKMRISPNWNKNSSLKGGDSMNPNSGRKKWVITIVIAAVLIAAAVAVAIFAGQGPE